MILETELKKMLIDGGACDVGFAKVDDGPTGLKTALTFVVPLSQAVVREITDSPTYTYFHHYRTVNALIDRLTLQAGLLIQASGYEYLPVAASQSQPEQGNRTHRGLYSHKKAAVLAGLGSIGKSALFLHSVHGPRVRLGTLFTNYSCDLINSEIISSSCGDCNICVKSCPAKAITGREWQPDIEREQMIDANICNEYMRNHFMKIGRGSVCGICISMCPLNK